MISDWVRMPTGFPFSVTMSRPISRSLNRRITSKSSDVGRRLNDVVGHHFGGFCLQGQAAFNGLCEIAHGDDAGEMPAVNDRRAMDMMTVEEGDRVPVASGYSPGT